MAYVSNENKRAQDIAPFWYGIPGLQHARQRISADPILLYLGFNILHYAIDGEEYAFLHLVDCDLSGDCT
jgi:hypothetical protein